MGKPLWTKWWVWLLGVVVMLWVVGTLAGEDGGSGGSVDDAATSCDEPADSWLDTLQSAFYSDYRDAAITDAAYVEYDTAEGVGYYVAVNVEGVSGVAVFGTSDPPLQADPGLMAASNPSAIQLSDLGADISSDSPAGTFLLDQTATSVAESCLA